MDNSLSRHEGQQQTHENLSPSERLEQLRVQENKAKETSFALQMTEMVLRHLRQSAKEDWLMSELQQLGFDRQDQDSFAAASNLEALRAIAHFFDRYYPNFLPLFDRLCENNPNVRNSVTQFAFAYLLQMRSVIQEVGNQQTAKKRNLEKEHEPAVAAQQLFSRLIDANFILHFAIEKSANVLERQTPINLQVIQQVAQAAAERRILFLENPRMQTESMQDWLSENGANRIAGTEQDERRVDEILKSMSRDDKVGTVVLYGPTGTGKTELALKAARKFSGHEPLVLSATEHLSETQTLGSEAIAVDLGIAGVRDSDSLIKMRNLLISMGNDELMNFFGKPERFRKLSQQYLSSEKNTVPSLAECEELRSKLVADLNEQYLLRSSLFAKIAQSESEGQQFSDEDKRTGVWLAAGMLWGAQHDTPVILDEVDKASSINSVLFFLGMKPGSYFEVPTGQKIWIPVDFRVLATMNAMQLKDYEARRFSSSVFIPHPETTDYLQKVAKMLANEQGEIHLPPAIQSKVIGLFEYIVPRIQHMKAQKEIEYAFDVGRARDLCKALREAHQTRDAQFSTIIEQHFMRLGVNSEQKDKIRILLTDFPKISESVQSQLLDDVDLNTSEHQPSMNDPLPKLVDGQNHFEREHIPETLLPLHLSHEQMVVLQKAYDAKEQRRRKGPKNVLSLNGVQSMHIDRQSKEKGQSEILFSVRSNVQLEKPTEATTLFSANLTESLELKNEATTVQIVDADQLGRRVLVHLSNEQAMNQYMVLRIGPEIKRGSITFPEKRDNENGSSDRIEEIEMAPNGNFLFEKRIMDYNTHLVLRLLQPDFVGKEVHFRMPNGEEARVYHFDYDSKGNQLLLTLVNGRQYLFDLNDEIRRQVSKDVAEGQIQLPDRALYETPAGQLENRLRLHEGILFSSNGKAYSLH